ncbi:MAG: hypothetical protein Q4G49_07585 [Paracoccus sp. (in: a-proteobacteria)]|nr:hypothetical protein [Paracoccus sp. (in: a-proteobacteria)]
MAGLDLTAVLDGLAQAGVIVTHDAGKGDNRKRALNKVFKVPSQRASHRLYQIDYEALMGVADDG